MTLDIGEKIEDAEQPSLSVNAFLNFSKGPTLARALGLSLDQFQSLAPGALAKLLMGRGIAVPIVAGDWEVSRMLSSAHQVGLEDWEGLQTFMRATYVDSTDSSSCIHLHKGPGNGALMDHLREADSNWQQVGIGDRLYFTIEDTLLRFVPEAVQRKPGFAQFLSVLGLGIRRVLKEQWYTNPDHHTVGELQLKQEEKIDLNSVKRILSNPVDLIQKLKISSDHKRYTRSVEFEEDGEAEFEPSTQKLVDQLFTAIAEGRGEEFLRGFFEPCLFDADKDLNEEAVFYQEGFIPGLFKNIKDLVPQESCLVISAIRSDSHETSQDFRRDIAKNLRCLRPGGVLITDGNRQSYTRFSRLREIKDALKENPNCRARVVVRSSDHAVLGVIIQKKQPNVGAIWDLRPPCFEEGVYFASLDKIEKRPDQVLLNREMPPILRLAEEDMGIFRQFHDRIRAELRELLADFAVEAGLVGKRASKSSEPELIRREVWNRIVGPKAATWSRANLDRVRHEFRGVIEDTLPPPLKAKPDTKSDAVKVYKLLGARLSPSNRPDEEIPSSDYPQQRRRPEPEKRVLTDWREQVMDELGDRGIALIDPYHCVTNSLLSGFLIEHLGAHVFDEKVRRIRFSLDDSVRGKAQRELSLFCEEGGLVIAGGSWADAYNFAGREYKRDVVYPFYQVLREGQVPLAVLAECFSAQTFADVLGSQEGERMLRTKKGSLEFGPFVMNGFNREAAPTLFKNLPEEVVVAMTRSGHVVDTRPADHPSMVHFRPVASMKYSGENVMWASDDKRLIATIAHSEIDLRRERDQGVRAVMRAVRKNPLGFVGSHGVTPRGLERNWRPVPVENNDGSALLRNMIATAVQASRQPSRWETSAA
jgi:hypothetical protein